MKLEPVAWMTHESSMRLKDGGNCKGAVPVHQRRSHASSIPLYAIPEGYVVVPVEPTEEMLEAGCEGYRVAKGDRKTGMGERALEIYKAMIAAKEPR